MLSTQFICHKERGGGGGGSACSAGMVCCGCGLCVFRGCLAVCVPVHPGHTFVVQNDQTLLTFCHKAFKIILAFSEAPPV